MTAPEDPNGLREALAPTYKKCPECAGSGTWECFGEDHCCEECSGSGSVEDLEPVILAERDAYRDRALAAEAEITRLKEGMEARDAALRPFAAGGPWGGWLSWLINGAPDREQGKAAAKQIVHWRAAVDVVLSPKEQL